MPLFKMINATKKEKASLEKIVSVTFKDEEIKEREHIQYAIKENIKDVLPDCMVISDEFSGWEDSKNRIDLLAIDKEANIVVIELKRDMTGKHMELQALRYAAMVSTLTYEQTIKFYSKYLEKNKGITGIEDAEKRLQDFLEISTNNEDNFNTSIKIVLMSMDFSTELTTTVMWLNDMGLDIQCYRLSPYKSDQKIYIDIQKIIPLPEAEEYLTKIKEQKEEKKASKKEKDKTKYEFEGKIYGKRNLVEVIFKTYKKSLDSQSEKKTIDELWSDFPDSQKNLFKPLNEAVSQNENDSNPRYFTDEDMILDLKEGKYVVSNQWAIGNIGKFIENATNLGYDITAK